jgi:hypothetical protein
MGEQRKPLIRRRDVVLAFAAVASLGGHIDLLPDRALAAPLSINQKRKARHRASSEEVHDFYRVNRYPAQ